MGHSWRGKNGQRTWVEWPLWAVALVILASWPFYVAFWTIKLCFYAIYGTIYVIGLICRVVIAIGAAIQRRNDEHRGA